MIGLLVSVVALSAVSVVVLLTVARYTDVERFASLGVLAFAGHVVFGTLVVPLLPYAWDIAKFHRRAVVLLEGGLPSPNSTVNAFAALQSVVYAVTVSDPRVISVVNGLCAVLIAVPVAALVRELYPDLHSTLGTVCAILFLPLPFVFTTIPMRDAVSVLLFVSILAAIARALDEATWLAVLAVPLWGALSLLRPELGAVLLLGTVAAVVVSLVERTSGSVVRFRTLVGTMLLPGIASAVLLASRVPVASFDSRRAVRATGGGAYLEGLGYETGVDLIVAAPVRAVYFQYAPFPLHISSAFDLVAGAMLPVLILLTIAAYRSARSVSRDTAVLTLVTTTYVLGVVGYGLVDSNFGTTVRHRIPFTFLLCIVAAPVLERWRKRLSVDLGFASKRGGE